MVLAVLLLVENPPRAQAEDRPVRADGTTESEKVETVAGNLEVTTQTYVPPELKSTDLNRTVWKFKRMGASATGEAEYAIPLFDPVLFKAEFVAPGKGVDDKVKLKFTSLKDLDPMNADQWGLGAKGEAVRTALPKGGGGGGGQEKKDWKEKIRVPAIYLFSLDRDNPENRWDLAILDAGKPVYAGGMTGDVVRFELQPMVYEASYAWTAVRKAPASPAVVVAGPTGSIGDFLQSQQWNGKAAATWAPATFDWKPGIYTVRCKVTKGGIESVYQRELEVGVRTDDVVVIGWINPVTIILPVAGVQPNLLRVLPVAGFEERSSNLAKLKAAFLVKYVSEDSVNKRFHTGDLRTAMLIGAALAGPAAPAGAAGGAALNNAIRDHFKAFSAEDKKYMICWMFKYGANVSPDLGDGSIGDGGNFQEARPSSHFSQAKLDAYLARNAEHTHFKLMNHFQVKFLTDAAHAAPIPFKAGSLKHLQHGVALGNTKDPTRFYDLGIPYVITRPMGYYDEGVFPGKPSALNGTQAAATSVVSQYNEGSPDQKAMDAFTHLHGAPVTFNIWSRINFFSDLASYRETKSPTTGDLLTRAPKPTRFFQGQINTQLYPTYWIYINGETRPEWKHAQHADPMELIKQKDNAQ